MNSCPSDESQSRIPSYEETMSGKRHEAVSDEAYLVLSGTKETGLLPRGLATTIEDAENLDAIG